MFNVAQLGNGITIYRYNSNEWLAHISIYRRVTYRDTPTPEEDREIKRLAKEYDPNISTSQDQKVFINRPKHGKV